jgi:hypothetical protein
MHGIVFTSAGELAAELTGRFATPLPGIATLEKGR